MKTFTSLLLISAGVAQAALVFSPDSGQSFGTIPDSSGTGGGFVPSNFTGTSGVINFTVTGQNDGLQHNIDGTPLTGSLEISSTESAVIQGSQLRGIFDNPTSTAPAGTGNFAALDFRPGNGGTLPANASITFSFRFNQALSNGAGTANNASLATALQAFGFANPPSGLTTTITPFNGNMVDFTQFTNESTGVASNLITANSFGSTSDLDGNNDYVTAFRDLNTTASDGSMQGWDITITNNSGSDYNTATGGGTTAPLYRVTFDGSAPTTQVPEPSGVVLSLLGLAAFASRRRR